MESCKGTEFEDIKKVAYLSINNKEYADEIEINLGDDYEYKFEMNRLYILKKKPVYPKTYEECCEVLFNDKSYAEYIFIPAKVNNSYYRGDFITELPFEIVPYETTIRRFYKLLICRDAYWKIAGEQMGLDKPWEPDWKNTKNVKYSITLHEDNITKMYLRNENAILAFPTEKMLDAFYENFKDLIEQCKEFL